MPTLDFRNGDVLLDWFPFHGGFHVSGGALIYNGNNLARRGQRAGTTILPRLSQFFAAAAPIPSPGPVNSLSAPPHRSSEWAGAISGRAGITSASPSTSASCSWANANQTSFGRHRLPRRH